MFVCMNWIELEKDLSVKLLELYSRPEAEAISDWVMEFLSGKKRAARMALKPLPMENEHLESLEKITTRLMKHEPVQYVLNESWFMGCRFFVDQRVLIPRPETEELVEWVISNCKFPLDELTILEVGTGSGCIPISLKRRLRKAKVYTIDASAAALEVAEINARALGTSLEFLEMDFLDRSQWKKLPVVDLLVSNPPYIPKMEQASLEKHVREFEPAMALFVPDEDVLVFYHALAEFGKEKLKKGGQIFAEIHENLSAGVSELFTFYGYDTILKTDLQGKQRMVRAIISGENSI